METYNTHISTCIVILSYIITFVAFYVIIKAIENVK